MESVPELIDLLIRFIFNIAVAYIIVIQIYQRYHNSDDFVFTYFMFNSIIFFFAFILGNMDLNIGFGFGLFAVFAILRYRTDPIPIKEMTYLFIVITTGVINALGSNQVSKLELLFANFMIIFLTFILENQRSESPTLFSRKTIEYDKFENIKPENHESLLIDLKNKTGLDIQHFEIGRIFLDKVNIKIFYKD